MSWQRIDENTYIDDTLVTCAEYQLFIDEMRQQGKFYQPDHWTSYQFPEGKAREPILGMRHSDAEAFCDWLTQQGEGKWKYCLPTQEETVNFSAKPHKPDPIGYWAIRTNDEQPFVWIGTVPINPRIIDLKHIINLPVDLKDAIAIAIVEARALDLSRAREHISYYVPEIGSLERMREDLYREEIKNALIKPVNRANIFADAITFSLNLVRDRSAISGEKYYRSLNLISDVITLQERIAGRSPAFEGIRLVKERIR